MNIEQAPKYCIEGQVTNRQSKEVIPADWAKAASVRNTF